MKKQPNPNNVKLGKQIAELIHATMIQENDLYNPHEVGQAIAKELNHLCLTVDPQGVEYENLSQGSHLVLLLAANALVEEMENEGQAPLI